MQTAALTSAFTQHRKELQTIIDLFNNVNMFLSNYTTSVICSNAENDVEGYLTVLYYLHLKVTYSGAGA